MARGPKKHLKRLNAPHHWMLDKLGGTWAPRPSTGPHKLRECLPIILILRERLKYALNKREVMMICMQKLIKVDGRVRTDPSFPCGFMDVVSIQRSNDMFRLMYDTKGRYVLQRIKEKEAEYKLCKVKKTELTSKKIPFLVTHDGRTIRYPDPISKVNDTVKVDIKTGKIVDTIKFEIGKCVTVTKGRNCGRVGTLMSRDKHPGSFDIVHVKDDAGHTFATRMDNVFVLGEAGKPQVTLPKQKGIKLDIFEEKKKKESGAR
jgi:small subunit ribosomal protein S4e